MDDTLNIDSNACLEECQWMTYDSDGEICLMFEDCLGLDNSCSTCLSSQKYCSEKGKLI